MIAALLLMTAAPDESLDCSDPGVLPQQGLNFCAREDYERADAELNAQWKRVAVAMRESDREMHTLTRAPIAELQALVETAR